VDRGTGREPPDPVLGWAVAEVRAAGERVVAERAGAGVLVRREAAPACGIPVWPEAVVAAPGQVAELEPAVGVVPVAGAALAGAEAQELAVAPEQAAALVSAEGQELAVVAPELAAALVSAGGQEQVVARERALVARVGVAPVA
jgi:hypothetical protein